MKMRTFIRKINDWNLDTDDAINRYMATPNHCVKDKTVSVCQAGDNSLIGGHLVITVWLQEVEAAE